jgi:hypothetical protein
MSLREQATRAAELAAAEKRLDEEMALRRGEIQLRQRCHAWVVEHLGAEPVEVTTLRGYGGKSLDQRVLVDLEDDIKLVWYPKASHTTASDDEPGCWLLTDKNVSWNEPNNVTGGYVIHRGPHPDGWESRLTRIDVSLSARIRDLASLGVALQRAGG